MKDIDEEVKLEGLDEDYPKPILIEDLGLMYATEKSKQKKRFGVYKCGFCGDEFKASTYDINRGHIKSCGCYKKRITGELNKTHGFRTTRLYNIWSNIKDRVLNIKTFHYLYYGGRGITICDEWKNDFMPFYNWAMAKDYSDELSIDRIDNDGNYEPNNCRWTTQTIQNRNKRIQTNNTSGYKGVSYNKKMSRYRAKINVNKKRIHLGYFQTAVEGAIAYNNYIIENNLEGFILNEIPEGYEDGKNLLKK